jgi:GTPase SAR1 family protein
MLLRFSVIGIGGIEVIKYESKRYLNNHVDSDIASGFMEAMQLYSEVMGSPVQQIQFVNMILYLQTYGDFTIRILVDETIETHEMKGYFEKISKIVSDILPGGNISLIFPIDTFKKYFFPILKPILEKEIIIDSTTVQNVEPIPFVIGIVGLSNVGKTTIKKLFFDGTEKKELIGQIRPTIGIEHTTKFLASLDQSLILMDFGGQDVYRDQYLKQKSFFNGLQSLIFVVDVQDETSFEIAKRYLDQIWSIIINNNLTKPKLSIFLHKYDINKRKELVNNVSKCFAIFADYLKFSSINLTCMEDSSSNVALINTLYFTLPDLVLKQMFQEILVDKFQEYILPKYSIVYERGDATIDEMYNSAVFLGLTTGISLQEKWVEYVSGDVFVKARKIGTNFLTIFRESEYLIIKLFLSPFEQYKRQIVLKIIEGIMEGLSRSLHLTFIPDYNPNEEKLYYLVWKLKL